MGFSRSPPLMGQRDKKGFWPEAWRGLQTPSLHGDIPLPPTLPWGGLTPSFLPDPGRSCCSGRAGGIQGWCLECWRSTTETPLTSVAEPHWPWGVGELSFGESATGSFYYFSFISLTQSLSKLCQLNFQKTFNFQNLLRIYQLPPSPWPPAILVETVYPLASL